ncbi:LysE family translocator [Luteolibacter pohnpeiensis]|uniref:LysE family translocator n=1 Tax=Luteolibacter pohnpeiensis TaxID=454153 RepID=A0A934S7Q0_9BACT|nr:LysE family translocator [Luteolibacter pohnpeiensis]MBK1881232.1 LysE family translocator [Luteolibacter pohnpeiensis]
MFSESKLILFFAATVAMILTPGPAVLYIVARGFSQGVRSTLISVTGIFVGNLSHALAAALGLSAVFASSPLAYAMLKYLGAGYLLYLGIRKFMTKPVPVTDPTFQQENAAAVFRQGMMVGLFNPKIALFLLAFLPQFTSPGTSPMWLQLLILGVAFVLMGYVGDSCFALLSGSIGGWIRRHPKFGEMERWISGGIFCLLGIGLLLIK